MRRIALKTFKRFSFQTPVFKNLHKVFCVFGTFIAFSTNRCVASGQLARRSSLRFALVLYLLLGNWAKVNTSAIHKTTLSPTPASIALPLVDKLDKVSACLN
jgi:hypothetical protein